MIKVLGNIKKESFHLLKNKPNTQPCRDEIWSKKMAYLWKIRCRVGGNL